MSERISVHVVYGKISQNNFLIREVVDSAKGFLCTYKIFKIATANVLRSNLGYLCNILMVMSRRRYFLLF